MERAIELTLHQLSDTGDDDVLLRDALRDMIEVLVDDQVCRRFSVVRVHSVSRFLQNFRSRNITEVRFSCLLAPASDMKSVANALMLKAQCVAAAVDTRARQELMRVLRSASVHPLSKDSVLEPTSAI